MPYGYFLHWFCPVFAGDKLNSSFIIAAFCKYLFY